MTNITELAQSLKAAAEKASDGDWVKESGDGWEAACSANDQANGGFIIAHFEGPDAAENREFVQAANPANIIALVEALEKAQQYAKERDEENQDLMLTIGRFRVEREGLEAIRAAAEKLVRCKGRYHSEQNYRALAALFGVKTPDLPPLDSESRTVKLPAERFCPAEYAGSQLWSETEVWNKAITACADALRADGIKVEAE